MKVNAININNSANVNRLVRKNQVNINTDSKTPGYSIISFKGGNKEQAIIYGAELRPYQQIGGVSTVLEDIRGLRVSTSSPIADEAYKKSFDFWTPKDKVMVTNLYNGMKVYNNDTGLLERVEVARIPEGLPETSAFKKYEGRYFVTKNTNFQDYKNPLEFFLKEEKTISATGKPNLKIDSNIFILEDVTGGKKTIDFGGTGETEIKLFRVMREHEGKLKATNDFKIFTDVTASWKKAYDGGGYASGAGALAQSWKGDGDARAAKGFTALIERICEVKSQDGVKFDPATILLNDSQAAYASEYIAEEAAKGGEFWNGKKATLIVHNAGDGYIQKTSNMNMFVNIADKELRSAIENDPEFIKVLKMGGDEVERYFAKLLPDEMKDLQGGVSPFRNTLYYAEHGFVPIISTVSEGYHQKLVSDPDFAPGTHAYLKSLSDKGRFIGITNAFENAGMNPYSGMIGGYAKEYTFPNNDAAGKLKGVKIPAYKLFDSAKVNEKTVDINHVREIKRLNKISLFERLDKDALSALETLKDVPGHEYDMSTVIAGLPDKKVKVYGYIDKKYLDAAKKGKDVKLLTSWGRGDTQKALDSVLKAFEQYVLANGEKDTNSVLVMGGEIPGGEEGEALKKIIDRMNSNPKLKGRFVYMDGFAPNKPLAAAADFAVFPSRFAPCELTDLEAMKVFCSPIVTNCQGLAQKNFDASFEDEAERVTGYKTKHEFDMSMEELKNKLDDKTRTKLDKAIQKFKDKLNSEYRIKFGKELTDAEIMEAIRMNGGLNYEYRYKVLRPFRDKVIEDELVECFVRALIMDRNKEIQTKMVINQVRQLTDLERNGSLSKTGKSTAELYRVCHLQSDRASITEQDTLLYKLRKNCKEAIERAKRNQDSKTHTGDAIKDFFKSKSGKWTIGGIAAAAIIGILIGSSKHNNEPEQHLSSVV